MGLFKNLMSQNKEIVVKAPISGEVKPLSSLNDGVFSEKLLGEGCVIHANQEMICAPFDGCVEMLAVSKHAIGLKSDQGVELLIHVGLDTVNMEGEGFAFKVQEKETVKSGQPLMTFSKEKIAAAGYPDDVIMIVTNTKQFKEVHVCEKTRVEDQEIMLRLVR